MNLEQRVTPEEEFVQLLAKRRGCADRSERAAIDRELVLLVEENLRDQIRQKMGSRVGGGGTRQFTNLLNQFFANVLERAPDMEKVETHEHLLNYIARAMGNMLNSHYRSKKVRDVYADEIRALAADSQEQLRSDCSLEWPEVLAELDKWDEQEDRAEWAKLLRRYYLLGMTYEAIGEEIGCSTSTVERRIKAALTELQQVLLP